MKLSYRPILKTHSLIIQIQQKKLFFMYGKLRIFIEINPLFYEINQLLHGGMYKTEPK